MMPVRGEYRPVTLTRRQRAILNYIRTMVRVQGYPPSVCEIGEHFGISSTNGVTYHLRALEAKGYIKRDYGKARAIRVLR